MKKLLFIAILVMSFSNCFAKRMYYQIRLAPNTIIINNGTKEDTITVTQITYIKAVNYLAINKGYCLVDTRVEENSVGQMVFYMYKELQ